MKTKLHNTKQFELATYIANGNQMLSTTHIQYKQKQHKKNEIEMQHCITPKKKHRATVIITNNVAQT